MKKLLMIPFLATGIGLAADSGEALSEPKTLLKFVTAIEASKLPGLTSSKDKQGTSYHLRKAVFLGTVNRDHQIYTVAHAVFVRSSPPGRDTPPPRGHDFIVVLDSKFQIVAHGQTSFGEYRMRGEQLFSEDSTECCADFASTDASVRYGGYPEINMPYPFKDRISEEDWQSGVFLKTLSEKDRKSGLFRAAQPDSGSSKGGSTGGNMAKPGASP